MMDDIVKSLKEIVKKYPDVLNDDKKLKSILKDYFPEDKRTQNHLYMVYEEGILEDMKDATEIKKFKMVGYIHSIADDYGISESMAKEAIIAWTKALKIKAEDVSIRDNRVQQNQDSIAVGNTAINFENEDINSLHFSGKGGRVIPNIQLERGAYAVKVKGKVLSLNFYDAKHNKNEICSWIEKEKECMFQTGNINISKPGYFEIKNFTGGDNDTWTVDVVKLN